MYKKYCFNIFVQNHQQGELLMLIILRHFATGQRYIYNKAFSYHTPIQILKQQIVDKNHKL